MILRNIKGIERKFDILFEVKKNNQKYIIYRDQLTDNIYAGKYEKGILKALDDKEFELINNILGKLNS